MLDGASEAVQSHNIKSSDPEKIANLGLKIRGRCILLKMRHDEEYFER
jgi:hypothetical protein